MSETENDKQREANSAAVQRRVLLPCPFCGSEDVGVTITDDLFGCWVSCGSCEADGPMNPIGNEATSHQDAADAWNRRVGECSQIQTHRNTQFIALTALD